MENNLTELYESFYSGYNDKEAVIILTLAFIKFLESHGYSKEQYEQFFTHAKADFNACKK